MRGVAGVSDAADVVAAHEEWFDGSGYPAGLSGQEIPLEARIVACAAAFVKLARDARRHGRSERARAAVRERARPRRRERDPALLTREHGHPARHLRDVPAA